MLGKAKPVNSVYPYPIRAFNHT